MKILIIEDDDQTAEVLTLTLNQHGHDTMRAPTAAVALNEFPWAQTILLDLGLPDLDGHELCRRLRARTDVPIIAVTGRCAEVDRLMAFHLGADDYVVKPFSSYELLARIEAVARRATRSTVVDGQEPEPTGQPRVLRLGELQVDLRARRVTVGDRQIRLTRKEFDLLTVLMEETGTVKTREEILSRVWDENWFGSTRTLDVHVGSLRNKLGAPGWIETVRGVGYRVDIPEPNAAA